MVIPAGLAETIKRGAVGVMPTDTIYGLVASAFSPAAIERIYELKRRTPNAGLVVLVSSMTDLKKLAIKVTPNQTKIIKQLWPGPFSIILPCRSKKLAYLHRGNNSLAIRLSKEKWLTDFIKKTGPIVATSVNLQGQKNAEDISAAKKIFGQKVDFLIGKKKLAGKPSTIVKLVRDGVQIVRQGSGKIPKNIKLIT